MKEETCNPFMPSLSNFEYSPNKLFQEALIPTCLAFRKQSVCVCLRVRVRERACVRALPRQKHSIYTNMYYILFLIYIYIYIYVIYFSIFFSYFAGKVWVPRRGCVTMAKAIKCSPVTLCLYVPHMSHICPKYVPRTHVVCMYVCVRAALSVA